MFNQMKYVLGVLLSFCMVSESFAIGSSFIGNEVLSARAAGEGYVGVAGQNDDPTAVYTNPGAMTALKGTQATLGITVENIHGGYQNNAGNETKERVTDAGVPNFSATQSFMDGKLSAGLSAQSPFGLETHWDGNSPLRYVATNSVLHMVDITPAVAYQIHPMVSVGAGIDYINLFDAQLDRAVATGGADGNASLRGQATNWGYHAGVVFKPAEQHSFGIAYHSKVDLRVNGNIQLSGLSGPLAAIFGGSSFATSAFTDVVLPENVQFGYAFKPNEKWLFEADAAWYHWSSSDDLNVRYPAINSNTLQSAVLNQGNPTPTNPRDAWSANTGVNYKVSDRWQVRSGLWYEPSILPDTTFSPAYMDQTRYGVSIGAGYGLTENLSIDAAYSAVFTHNRTIANNVGSNTTGNAAYNIDGTYSDFANVLALNITYKFGGK